MTTEIFKTAKKAASELNRIASSYVTVTECALIGYDMNLYANDVIEWEKEMKAEKSFYNYSRKLYIRNHGVESEKARAEFFGGILAVVTVKYDKIEKSYTITKENI